MDFMHAVNRHGIGLTVFIGKLIYVYFPSYIVTFFLSLLVVFGEERDALIRTTSQPVAAAPVCLPAGLASNDLWSAACVQRPFIRLIDGPCENLREFKFLLL